MVFLTWMLIGCAPGCPRGTGPAPERLARLPTGAPVGAPVCFGTVPELGVRDDDGRLLLDAATDDRLLAARVEHLLRHGAVPTGPDCEAALLREEADAWAHELRRRQALGVEDPTCPVAGALGPDASSDAITAWIASSPHPRAAGLRASHQRRCRGS